MTEHTEKKSKFAILFVDDEEMARKYFTLTFKKDYTIFTAESVDEATTILEEKNSEIGVLITDQRMPGKLGVDLLKKARANYPAIIRLLTTAYSDLDDAIAAVNSGEILRYISKPWDFDQLGHELYNALKFFELRNERDQLLGEKLSVVQHMASVNRVRDLIMLSAGITHCDRSLTAMTSLLTQLKISAIEQSVEEHLEMWGNIESEITNMLTLSEIIKTNTKLDNNSVAEIDLINHCKELAEKSNVIQFESELSVGVNVLTIPSAIARIFQLIDNSKNIEVNISIAIDTDNAAVLIRVRAENHIDNLKKINGDLISTFLLSYHLGGEVLLVQNSGMGLDISLPMSIKDKVQDVIESHWLDKILAQYEQ